MTAPPPRKDQAGATADSDLVWRVTHREAPAKSAKPHPGVATVTSGSGWLSTPSSSSD